MKFTLDEWNKLMTSQGRTIVRNKENGEIYTVIGIQHNPSIIFRNLETGISEQWAFNCSVIEKFELMEVKK
jgi:hypothetical protein